MTERAGMQVSYVNTVPQKTVMSDRVINTDPMVIPLIAALGMDAGSKFRFVNDPGRMYEWLYDTYSPVSSHFDDTTTLTVTSSTGTSLAVHAGDGKKFQPGDVLQVDDEYIWVSSIATDTLTVTRAYAGSTSVTHASTSVVYIRSRARLEGASAADSHFTEVSSDYNYTAIFQKTIEISRSDQRVSKWGIPNILEYEKDKKMAELLRELAAKPYYGYRQAATSSLPPDFGGFDTFVASAHKVTGSSAALTKKMINTACAAIVDDGGNPNLLVCGTFGIQKINALYAGEMMPAERSSEMGGVTISKILTDTGPILSVLRDPACPGGVYYFLSKEEVSYVTIDEFFWEDLAKTKDTSGYGQIVGEYGFAMSSPNHHYKLYSVSTTA